MMNGSGKSDRSVVPRKPANKAARAAAESVGGRDLAKGNTDSETRPGHRADMDAPSELDRVREAARRNKETRFTALLHHVTIDRLRGAFLALRRDAAPGVDGVTWEQYAEGLEEKLADLHARLHRGAYRARPSRRVYIPKPDGKQRPLGIATLEDKIVQRAVSDVLNAIYETDFLDFSYGFRPGRGPHDGLDALATGILHKKVNWVLDADIRGFFDAIDHERLMQLVGHRIGDERVLRLIRKWLSAGVMEKGRWTECEEGTPQGATISPLLASVYLHYVLDQWAERWRRERARGDMIIVRFADDFVVGFQRRSDAERFQRQLTARFREYALELHPDKTRLIEFGSAAARRRKRRGEGKPETFHFLGLLHICAERRSGGFLLARHTRRERLQAKLREVKQELQRRRHRPIKDQGRWLGNVVRGFLNYHAVPTNGRAIQTFVRQIERYWLRALRRRSQRHRMTWKRMQRLSRRWLPRARIQHPYPDDRFFAKTRGKSPVR